MKGAKVAKAAEAAVVAVVATLLPSCSCHRRTFYLSTLPTAYAFAGISHHPNH
jgi:hypothetical protein